MGPQKKFDEDSSHSVRTVGACVDRNDSAAQSMQAIREHYRDTVDDYWSWSPEGNLHFGYWRWRLNPFRRSSMLAEMNRQVMLLLDLPSEHAGNVADLGCGVAATSRYGVQMFPRVHWHAMNVSPDQIEFAKRNYDTKNICFHCTDYHRLPWSDSSIDGAFFVESLCYSRDPEAVICEVARVLRPGARLVITDGFLRRPIHKTSRWFQWLFSMVANNWAVPAYHEIANFPQWANTAGLDIISCREIGLQISPSVIHSIPLTLWCTLQLKRSGVKTAWRWRQLRASSCAMLLGLHRWNFGYYLIAAEKTKLQR